MLILLAKSLGCYKPKTFKSILSEGTRKLDYSIPEYSHVRVMAISICWSYIPSTFDWESGWMIDRFLTACQPVRGYFMPEG